jgi:TolB-like protein
MPQRKDIPNNMKRESLLISALNPNDMTGIAIAKPTANLSRVKMQESFSEGFGPDISHSIKRLPSYSD